MLVILRLVLDRDELSIVDRFSCLDTYMMKDVIVTLKVSTYISEDGATHQRTHFEAPT